MMAEIPSFYVYGDDDRLHAIKDDPRQKAGRMSAVIAEHIRLTSPEPDFKTDNTELKRLLKERVEQKI